MTSLLFGGVLASIPSLAYFNSVWDPATVSSWNFVVSVMQYLLIGGLVIAVLGLLWRGPIGRESVLAQIGFSIGVGAWMFLVSLALIAYWFTWSLSCPDPTLTRCLVASAEYPAAALLPLGQLIPALSFISSIVWLIRHKARSVAGFAKLPSLPPKIGFKFSVVGAAARIRTPGPPF